MKVLREKMNRQKKKGGKKEAEGGGLV